MLNNNSFFNDLDPDFNYSNSQNLNSTSNYFSIEDYNSHISKVNSFSIVNHNIRSFSANSDAFLCSFEKDSLPDAFVFSETWVNNFNNPQIPEYNSYHTHRDSGRSGGVSVFVKKQISSEFIPELSFARQSIEVCSVKISTNSESFIIMGIYRPHAGTTEDFLTELDLILNSRRLQGSTNLLLGDFNINFLSDCRQTELFINKMRSYHYSQLLSKPTRIPNIDSHVPTLLDHIWVNKLMTFECGIILNDITDHLPSFILLPFTYNNSQINSKIKITFRDNSPSNLENLNSRLRDFDWNSIKNDNPNKYLNNFIEKINLFYRSCFPLKTKLISAHSAQNPWCNKYAKKLIKAKSEYFNLWRMGYVTTREKNSYNNKVKSIISKIKFNYQQNLFAQCRNNARKTWKLINSFRQKGDKNASISKILFNNVEYDTDESIANLFNKYFANAPIAINENIPISTINPLHYIQNFQNSSFFLYPTSEPECSSIISNLKPSKQDINCIPIHMFIYFKSYYIETITNIINLCFLLGIFPDVLKEATIVPIFKKGTTTSITNYRPIALLPFFSKILEKTFLTRLTNFITKFKLITPSQFGFSKGKSTEDAVNTIAGIIYDALDNKNICLNVFLDLQKAFDTIDHSILARKLHLYGIRGIPLQFISSFLSNRKQRVRINNSFSSFEHTSIGLPQGAQLSPTLFLLFINDLPNVSNFFNTLLYADDTTLTYSHSNLNELTSTVNRELTKVYMPMDFSE